MEFEKKVLSREIQQYLYESGLTVGSAESCTGGRIAEAIIAVPGASTYFKGGVISYTNEVKENLLGVDHQLLEEKTAVCEEVAKAMVQGAIKLLVLTSQLLQQALPVLVVEQPKSQSVQSGLHAVMQRISRR